MEISEIVDSDSFRAWLEDKPIAWAQALAARIALRVAPMAWSIAALSDDQLSKQHRQNLTLLTFRASFISSAARIYPADDMRHVANAARVSITGGTFSSAASNAFSASFYAAASSTNDVTVYFESANAVHYAARAARAAVDATDAGADADIWGSIRADCEWLLKHDGTFELGYSELGSADNQKAAMQLAKEPLWMKLASPDTLPIWLKQKFHEFNASDLAQETSFGLITDWYRAILQGKPSLFGEKADIAIAQMDPTLWGDDEKGFDAVEVMDRVAELAGWETPIQKQTMSDFIVSTLEVNSHGISINRFVELFAFENYSSSRKSIRGRLNELTARGEISRIDRGIYASNTFAQSLDAPALDVDAPKAIVQGAGPEFSANRLNELDRIAAPPTVDEIENVTLHKLFERLKKRLSSVTNALGNNLDRYPQLAEVLGEYKETLNHQELSGVDIDDLWISGVGLISQARSFAAIDPSKQVTEPLEPQAQAILGELARLHGALIMGFSKGRELAEQSGIPLLSKEEFAVLLENEKAIVRWLLESEQYALSDNARHLFQQLDNILFSATEGADEAAKTGYPVLRNLVIHTANTLEYVEKTAGRLSLVGVPVHLAVGGALVFLQSNLSPILAFANSVPELRAYLEYHLHRLEIEYQQENKDGENKLS